MANKSNQELWKDIREYRSRIDELEPLGKENERLMAELDDLKEQIAAAEGRAERLAYQIKDLERQLIKGKKLSYNRGYQEGRAAR